MDVFHLIICSFILPTPGLLSALLHAHKRKSDGIRLLLNCLDLTLEIFLATPGCWVIWSESIKCFEAQVQLPHAVDRLKSMASEHHKGLDKVQTMMMMMI